ncbi:YEATS family [Fragilaria crotonensis]|nr:YEATS family [Fragilaria crotonensis]
MMPTTETGAVESDGVTAASVAVPMDPIITTTGPTAVVANHVLPLAGEAATKNRLANTTVCLPIVYGSIAFFLGKKADEYHTHKWTLYLRGPNDEDLGVCIQKVVFQLHPSFAQPDPSEKATVVNHGIKLYPQGSTNMQPTKEPVVAEVYDEVVFTDPKESFFQSLMKVAEVPKIPFPDDAVQACVQRYSDEDDFQALLKLKSFAEGTATS